MIDDRFIITASDFALLRDLASHERLADELDNAEVVDSRRIPPNVATMNSRLRFEDQATGETREVTIVFPQDADAANGKVSVSAPVGTALLGLAENQSIVWPSPTVPSGASGSWRSFISPKPTRRSPERPSDPATTRSFGRM